LAPLRRLLADLADPQNANKLSDSKLDDLIRKILVADP
jgi:hypothetical protein